MKILILSSRKRIFLLFVALLTVLGTAAGCTVKDTSSAVITEYPVPITRSVPYANSLHGITAGPDGNLWFTEPQGNKIGKLVPATGAITEYPVTTTGSIPYGITGVPMATYGSPRLREIRLARLSRRQMLSPRTPSPPVEAALSALPRVPMATCGSPKLRGIKLAS